MKIAFIDLCEWDYHVDSVPGQPLGGSQSAACYLAKTLAGMGHEVYFFSQLSSPGLYSGVDCRSLAQTTVDEARLLGLDVVVALLIAGWGTRLRGLFEPNVLILWNQHAHDQPLVQSLKEPEEASAYDAFAMVSEWQRNQFHRQFAIEPERMVVMRNAIAPAFESMYPEDVSIISLKTDPPILTYTSTPFRGLDLLLEAFGPIREAVPGTRLQVFSSMRVYHTPQDQDEERYGKLYRACRETEGVEYHGSVPQPELAARLREATMLAYPNSFAETSCIAVMEAMAAGCRVVTSDLGALPETTAGFAPLIPVTQDRASYLRSFVFETIGVLQNFRARPEESERLLRRQVTQMNAINTWEKRALEWESWLSRLCAAGSQSKRQASSSLKNRLGSFFRRPRPGTPQ